MARADQPSPPASTGSPHMPRRWLLAIAATFTLAATLLPPNHAHPASAQTGVCPFDVYAAAATGDAATVEFWNERLLETFRRQGGGPTPLSRAAAMMHVGIYDVFNSVYFSRLEASANSASTAEVCGWEYYLVLARTDPDVDADLAAAVAARDILAAALPDQASYVNDEFDQEYGSRFDADAFTLGTYVAHTVIAARANDGSDAPMQYIPDGVPGSWRSTEDAICESNADAVTPDWGLVDPFNTTLTSYEAFRPDPPGGFNNYEDLLESQFYADQWDDVYVKGRYDADEEDRGEDETELAWFWANDLDGTYKPPGQHLDHTREVVDLQPDAVSSGDPEDFETDWSQQGIRVARLFAQMSLALADAGIAAWDTKYQTDIDLWRPVTAIHEGDDDGNPFTFEDDDWQPLSRTEPTDPLGERPFSPCFPAWVSGHATFGAAWAQILEDEFHAGVDFTDPFPLELGTEDPHAENVTRTFSSFHHAAREDADSRVYLGVHFPIDADDGHDLGRAVADQLNDTHLRYNQTCPNWTCLEPVPTILPPTDLMITQCFNWDKYSPSVDLAWTPHTAATGYRVYFEGNLVEVISDGSANSATYLASSLPAEQAHSFWITALDGSDESPPSNIVQVEVKEVDCFIL